MRFDKYSVMSVIRKMIDKCLLLSWRRVLIMAGAWILSALLHKAMYGPFDEYFAPQVGLAPNAVFILGTLVIPVYFIICLVYTAIRKIKYDQYLLLSWRTLLIVPAWVLSVVLHNLIYGLFFDHFSRMGGDEAVFFIVALLVIPLYLIISVVYTVIRQVGKLVRSRSG